MKLTDELTFFDINPAFIVNSETKIQGLSKIQILLFPGPKVSA